ncbi:MAG TPA: protein translocase subunit SecF [Actinomycetes bacterium]
MSRLRTIGGKLYRGEVSYDFVGHRRRWYAVSGVILLIAVLSLIFRPLNLGVDFKGGSVFTVPTATGTIDQARAVAAANNVPQPVVTEVTSGNSRSLRVQTQDLSTSGNQAMIKALATEFHTPAETINAQIVGPSWGKEITKKAFTGLVVFLILIAIFLSLYFEWRMAVAALVALIHDLVVTIGIYSLIGFVVTPATVIGVLTILGYSLYDTVVVFDKVKENTRGLSGGNRMTYSQAANLALNQTLVRSINTSVIALLPVAAILFIGPLLGADTLKDLALALFVGLAAGAYSSIFIATPVLAQLKEREPAMQALARRVAAREAAGKGVATGTGAGSTRRRSATAVAERTDVDIQDSPDDVELPADGVAPGNRASTAGQRNQPRKAAKRRPANKRRR